MMTDEQMTEQAEYIEWASTVTEPDFTPEPGTGVPAEYAHLTPSEQAEQVDEEWREERAWQEAQERIPHRWQ